LSEIINRAPRRISNPLRFRQVDVLSKTLITDSFYRIELGGESLAGFSSPGFDDHVKVFFPDTKTATFHLPEITEAGVIWQDGIRPAARDYTPIFFDGEKRLTLDFYRHPSGLACDWAAQAKPGDQLIIGGPRASLVVPEDYDVQWYVCDETGLPAFLRRCQHLRGSTIKLYAWTDEATGRAYLPDLQGIDVCWLGRNMIHGKAVDDLIAELNQLALPDEDYFIWLTGEGAAVKQLNDYFILQRGLTADLVRAVAYWHRK